MLKQTSDYASLINMEINKIIQKYQSRLVMIHWGLRLGGILIQLLMLMLNSLTSTSYASKCPIS